jgi:hypothetical protein
MDNEITKADKPGVGVRGQVVRTGVGMGDDKPTELRPVLALIRAQGDLGLQEWREVVYYDDEAEEWRSYAGSDTFEDGEQVVRWVYAEAVLP